MAMLGQIIRNFAFAHRQSGIHQSAISKALQRLTSGKRINSAADDAAGLAISQRMRAGLVSLETKIKNFEDEVGALSTLEGGMAATHDLLKRMRELALQAAGGSYSDMDRELLNEEYASLMDEIDSVYNNYSKDAKVPPDMRKELGVGDIARSPGSDSDNSVLRDSSILTQEDALNAAGLIDKAIEAVSYSRAGIGAGMNVLDHRISALKEAALRTAESLSVIEDADMAKEAVNLAKASILNQVAQAMMLHSMEDSKRVVRLLMEM
jgi:flagellin